MRIDSLSKHNLKILIQKERAARKKVEDENISDIIVLQQVYRAEIDKKDQVISRLKDANFKLRDTNFILKNKLKKIEPIKIEPIKIKLLTFKAKKSNFDFLGMVQKKTENTVMGSQFQSDSITKDTSVKSMISFFNGTTSKASSSSFLSSNGLDTQMDIKKLGGKGQWRGGTYEI